MGILFAVSDIHGHYELLIKVLNESGFDIKNLGHKLIVLGDLFDRGRENVLVYRYLKNLKTNNKAVILKGNHELFFRDLDDNNPLRVHFNYLHNGFDKTISEFSGIPINDLLEYTNYELKKRINENHPELLTWINDLPYYLETKNYIFSHAGFHPDKALRDMDWRKAVWTKSETLADIDFMSFGYRKTLIMGHRPTSIMGENNYDIHYSQDGQKIYIDGGVAYGGKINVLKIENNT